MDLQLTEAVFVVTAASGGLGRATAEALLGEGARVVAVARRGDVLAGFAAEHPGRVATLAADLTATTTAEEAVDLALTTFGRLDGGFVSVGGPARGTVRGTTDATWREAFEGVFIAALRVARAVCERATSAPVLGFVLSTSAKVPLDQMAPSNGLRPGLAVLIKELADELGPVGGRAFGLLPGAIATERMRFLSAAASDAGGSGLVLGRGIPLGRMGEPAEFGRVAAFLMSPAASYVSGCVIPVDGGAMRAL